MSHVIPLWFVQMLNWHRWNCNVFEASRKMTELNYVRNLGGGVSVTRVRAAGPPDRRAQPGGESDLPADRDGSPTMSHVIPLPIFQVLKSDR